MGIFDNHVKDVIENGKGNFVAIDGSLLSFRAAAAGERKTVKIIHTPTGKSQTYKTKTEFKNHIKRLNSLRGEEAQYDLDDFTAEETVIPPKLKTSFDNVRSMINNILTLCDATEYAIYLDEGDTFRHKLATVQKYKGNRDGKTKPKNLKAVQNHLKAAYDAHVVTGIEADDVLNFYQYAGHNLTEAGSYRKIIAATFDKDAFGNVGWVFDFRKTDEGFPMMDQPRFIEGVGDLHYGKSGCKGFGTKFLWYQVVCGDTSDNYKPSKLTPKAFGHRAAHNLLKDLKTEQECKEAVLEKFKEWYPEPVQYKSWDGNKCEKDYLEIAQEYFDLARMRRWEEDTINIEDYL